MAAPEEKGCSRGSSFRTPPPEGRPLLDFVYRMAAPEEKDCPRGSSFRTPPPRAVLYWTLCTGWLPQRKKAAPEARPLGPPPEGRPSLDFVYRMAAPEEKGCSRGSSFRTPPRGPSFIGLCVPDGCPRGKRLPPRLVL